MSGAYSFLDVSASLVGIGGDFNIGAGAANAEEGITLSRTEDQNKMDTGADGEVMHSRRASKSGTATVRLLQTSPMNAKLMAMYTAQQATGIGWGQNLIVIRQTGAGDLFTCRQVAFKKVPDINYKKDGAFHEWTFDCGKIDGILGTY